MIDAIRASVASTSSGRRSQDLPSLPQLVSIFLRRRKIETSCGRDGRSCDLRPDDVLATDALMASIIEQIQDMSIDGFHSRSKSYEISSYDYGSSLDGCRLCRSRTK